MIITENVDETDAIEEGEFDMMHCDSLQTGGPFALLDEEGDIAYVSASKIGFTVTPGEAVYVPPRQLSFAPGGVVKARAERGSWDIWFLTTCNGVRSWQSTDGWWTRANELNDWELIHDEGATQ